MRVRLPIRSVSGPSRPRRSTGRGAGTRCSTQSNPVLSLVRRRRAQYLLQCARSPCRAPAAADQAALIYDQPGHRQQAHASPIASCATRVAQLAGAIAGSGVGKGDRVIIYMPMVPAGRDGDAGLRPDRRGPFGGVRRLCRQRAGDPHRRLPARSSSSRPRAASSPAASSPYKPLLDQAIEMARHKSRASCLVLQRPQAAA